MMKTLVRSALCACAFSALATSPALSHDGTHAASHAPIGVMADHSHAKGEVMISYRFMKMGMGGNRIGSDAIDPDSIVTTVPNRFFGMPMQPPTLRIVPLEMDMAMHMAGVMWAPGDAVTLMAMGSYRTADMRHVTYQGGMGTNELGSFTTEVADIGDTTVGAIVPISKEKNMHEWVVSAALSIPTGSTGERDQVLTPMGMTPTIRLPYPMQPGSGSWDLKPSTTYRRQDGKISFGAQLGGTIRLGTNDDGYKLGDKAHATAWVSYEPANWVSFSTRVLAQAQGRIRGIDPLIMGPVQTANPDFSGGESIDVLFGVNLAGTGGGAAGHRLAFEVGVPVWQNLNGPQMERDWSAMVGWQKAF